MNSFMSVRDTSRFIEKTTTGLTPLMLAARDENLENCLILLKSGESAEARTKFGVTPLHFAALNIENGIEIAWHLANQEKLDVKEKDEDGEEAIFYAVRKGNFRMARTLLELREKINNNLLHFFINQNRFDVAKIIHEWNPNLIKEVDSDRRNALHLAAQYADLRVCKWLIAQGIDVASKSCFGTALHRAPFNKNHGMELVHFFVSNNLDLNEKSKFGFVPLDAALAAENIDIARELLTLGASLNIKDHNFLHYCVFLNKLISARFIHELDKTLIRCKDASERDALHLAAEFADLEMCRWLVETGVPVDSLNGDRQTSVLHLVGLNSNHGTQLVGYFFNLGLDINEKDYFGFVGYSVRAKRKCI
ncbi:alpha-latrocrustotoxin-Lt1a-like [Cloeon dipterum]|uniref:alpha-latrocrustotoxin-Lt1a-like n=1 Tax=Cloeon dipterum TaxID=197152 RepID=UPI0032202F5E